MVFQGLVEKYNKFAASGDARSRDLPLVADPIYVICAAIAYLVMVTVGPRLMEKRQPLQLRNVLLVYNFMSVALSIYMMYEYFVCSFLNPDFNVFCQDVFEDDRSPLTMRMIHVHWLYFFSKLIEFSDTFFFVVRKKNNQITFLHIYHHVSMWILQYLLVKYVPGGVSYFGPLLNCFIHAVMYTYYMLSALGPHMQKYLWWKKYLTRMQMYQFVMIFLYCSNSMTYEREERPIKSQVTFFLWFHWFYMISLFWLFNHFYQNAYNSKKKTDDKDDLKQAKLKSN